MRGEYAPALAKKFLSLELPPRARRIRLQMLGVKTIPGTTSACAENTMPGDGGFRVFGNYLRVRGEYPCQAPHSFEALELPPRARRILRSARVPQPAWRNYLRVRGEYLPPHTWRIRGVELPPRARRIQKRHMVSMSGGGTTSACAENTPQPTPARENPWNYLRVRGEYGRAAKSSAATAELPPRARRIRSRG